MVFLGGLGPVWIPEGMQGIGIIPDEFQTTGTQTTNITSSWNKPWNKDPYKPPSDHMWGRKKGFLAKTGL